MRRELRDPISPAPADAGLRRWKSPTPYLFGGLSLMMVLIAVALILLACSFRKSSSSESSSDVKSEKREHALQPEMEPKVVVIMAGETNPTYLAKPVPSVPRNDHA